MRRRPRILCHVLAATAYLALALWTFRAVLPDPATLLPENTHLSGEYRTLGRLDLTMVLWVVTGTAQRLLERPSALRDGGQCHPLPDAFTLGEHMLGEGVLAAPGLALTGDPILAYNLLLVLTVWIPGVAMYALAHHFTRSPPAAFVAGVLFALEPGRIRDAGHPFIHGDLWAPLALLFLHRTFARGGFGNAFAWAAFLGLTVLESLYALLGVLLVLLAYGVYAGIAHRANVRRWLPPLAVAALPVLALAYAVFGPYLEARETWNVLVRSGTMFTPLESLAPGNFAFPGGVLLALAAISLADRTRGRRAEEGEDPRLALAAAALLVVWCSVRTVPLAGIEIPSPFLVLKQWLPGLDAVRALASVGRGAVLPASLLAAYAVLALASRRGAGVATALAAVLSLLVAVERWQPAVAERTFGSPLDLDAYAARPPDEDIALLRTHARGAVLDLPHGGGGTLNVAAGGYLMLESFSPRPTSACYNSFPSPLDAQVGALALALPRAAAVDALVALGFETLLLRLDRMPTKRSDTFVALIGADPAIAQRLEVLGRTERLVVLRMRSPVEVGDDPLLLATPEPDDRTQTVAPGSAMVELAFQNGSDRTWVQRAPIRPREVELRWHDASGAVVHRTRTRAVLPLAIAAGARGSTRVAVETPPAPGIYDLTLAPADAPERVLARTRVAVSGATDANVR